MAARRCHTPIHLNKSPPSPACGPLPAATPQVQSWTPQLVLGPLRQSPANKWAALLWCGVLVAAPTFMGGMVQVRFFPIQRVTPLMAI